MTPNAFLTDEAWLEIAPKLAEGIRMQIRRAASKFGLDAITADKLKVLLSFDGYKTHVKNLNELVLFAEKNILVLCEDRDSSHINQAYDKYVVCRTYAIYMRVI